MRTWSDLHFKHATNFTRVRHTIEDRLWCHAHLYVWGDVVRICRWYSFFVFFPQLSKKCAIGTSLKFGFKFLLSVAECIEVWLERVDLSRWPSFDTPSRTFIFIKQELWTLSARDTDWLTSRLCCYAERLHVWLRRRRRGDCGLSTDFARGYPLDMRTKEMRTEWVYLVNVLQGLLDITMPLSVRNLLKQRAHLKLRHTIICMLRV